MKIKTGEDEGEDRHATVALDERTNKDEEGGRRGRHTSNGET